MKIKLSGLAAEILKAETIDYNGKKDAKNLIDHLSKQDADLKKIQLFISVNENLISEEKGFSESDEVFVFNAFAGG